MRILAVDVGTGTQDILLFDTELHPENCFKLVMPSPTMMVARRVKQATRQGQPILLTGVVMGGGPSTWATRDHARAGQRRATAQTKPAIPMLRDERPKSRGREFIKRSSPI